MLASLAVLVAVGVVAYGVVQRLIKAAPVPTSLPSAAPPAATAFALPTQPQPQLQPPLQPQRQPAAPPNPPAARPPPVAPVVAKPGRAAQRGANGRNVRTSPRPPPVPGPVAEAPPPPAAPSRLISDPVWVRRPNGSEVTDLYPSGAQEDGIGGSAVIDCTVAGDGSLYDCGLLSERPSGRGFGGATLRLSSRFRMRPTTQSGETVEGRHVHVPVRWELSR